jgi:NAD(P)-dependent dehydrogenase (short-subunit alcohol dehydrogenase family)
MAEPKRTLAEYFSVEGRFGVITGAGGGLCGEMARSLAAPGARVAVLDRGQLERVELSRPGGFFYLQPEGIDATFALNFKGTLLPTQVFGRPMAARGSGSILNISSMNAFTPLTKIPAYAAAKAAVANFTRWLAVHFAHTGVRVNALAPREPTPRARQVLAHTPMGRYGEPEDLMGAVLWLLSDSSRFVTGSLVAIDGGFSSYSI